MPRSRALLLAASLSFLLLAGCSGSPSSAGLGAGDGGAGAPETLYLSEGRLQEAPDAHELEGNGFNAGSCTGNPLNLPTPGADSCWSGTFYGPARSSHKAGDEVSIVVWLQGQGNVGEPTVLEAELFDEVEGTVFAKGVSEGVSPAPSGPFGIANDCRMALVKAALAEDLAAGTALELSLVARNLFGQPCTGGGEDGNRLVLGEGGDDPGRPHGDGAGGPHPSEGPDAPEVLYAISGGHPRLAPTPSAGERDGSGFVVGGDVCIVGPASPASLLPCWGERYKGAAGETHAAGEAGHLYFWVQGTSTEPVVLEAVLSSEEGTIAEGNSTPMTPSAGTAGPPDDGCVLAEVDLPLQRDVPGGTDLTLVVRVDGLLGGECSGGGEDGNRLLLGAA